MKWRNSWAAVSAGIVALAVCIFVLVGSVNFGSAMSCLSAASEGGSAAEARAFTDANDNSYEFLRGYLDRSDFRLRNNSTKGNIDKYVWVTNLSNIKCYFINMISIEGTLLLVTADPSGNVVEIK